ncbi:inositol monophosphatase family protein [Nocardioides sp. 503]|uniref:inositol monophosphatase family protein n=1 Tax=Nocardioides sp. 503 TaxID=2508326 RepID=UPI001ADBA586|nr:inositol monophosphatase family protein [Nocardioides sp. 503]
MSHESSTPAPSWSSGGLHQPNPHLEQDRALLPALVAAVQEAGRTMVPLQLGRPDFETRDDVVAAIYANDDASLAVLRPRLSALRPHAGWVDDELEGGVLPPGEWWVADPVEGNINHAHGLPDWGVTATLVRDNVPVVTAIHLPLTDETYSAVLGGGADVNGAPLVPSAKRELVSALVGTGQAAPGESAEVFDRIGTSTTLMLHHAMVLRVSVPATLQLVQVAAGRMDVFWQFSQVRSGLLAGALVVAESGGVVSDTRGLPWSLDSPDFLATTPRLHQAAVEVLSTVAQVSPDQRELTHMRRTP